MSTYSSSQSGTSSDSGISLKKKNGIYGAHARSPIQFQQSTPIVFPVSTVGLDGLEKLPPASQKTSNKDERKNSREKHVSQPIVSPTLYATQARKDPTRSHRQSKTRHRERAQSLSAVPSATLTKLLVAQEEKMKQTQSLLNAALSQLDAASTRAAQAEAQLRAREASSVVAHTQLTTDAARAEEAAAVARREAEVYKLHLRQKDEEIRREKESLRREEQLRNEAEQEAARARSVARRWREEGMTIQAREEGRREGFGEGLRRGRVALAAAVATQGSQLTYGGNRGLVGDGTAYIEEYDHDENDSHDHTSAPSRRIHSQSQRSRSRHDSSRQDYAPPPSSSGRRHASAPTSHRHSRDRERDPVHSSTTTTGRGYHGPRNDAATSAGPSESASQAQTPRRARSVQTDFSTFQTDLPRDSPPSTAPPTSRVEPIHMPEPVVMPERPLETQTPRSSSSHTRSQASVQLPESHRDAPYRPPQASPPVPQHVTEPGSWPPSLTQIPQPQPVNTPPDVLPVNQVPLAPGLPQNVTFSQPRYASQPESFYFPMPAPPPNIVVTSEPEPVAPAPPPSSPSPSLENEIGTPSTMTGISMSGFNYLPSFPSVGRAGSASSSGTGTGAGAGAGATPGSSGVLRGSFGRGGAYERELSTIHEHSREGSTYNESARDDDYEANYASRGGLSESRSRSVDQWRRSLGDETPVSPNVPPEDDLLRPPSVASNSRRYLRPPLYATDSQGTLNSAGSDLRRQTSSGSTSTHSFIIQVEAPSRPSSPQDGHHYSSDDRGYLSPHHTPINLLPQAEEPPVIPHYIDAMDSTIDNAREIGEGRSMVGRMSAPGIRPNAGQIYTVNSLPPGFVPTPGGGGTRPVQLEESDDEDQEFQIYQIPPGVVTGGTPYLPGTSGGPYVNPNRQFSRGDGSNRGMMSGRPPSSSSSNSEDSRNYSRSRTPASLSGHLNSTFPSFPIGQANGSGSSSGTGSGRATPGTGGTLGGIYTVNSNVPLSQPPNINVGRGQTRPRKSSLRNEVGRSMVTAPAIPMPAPTVPQYSSRGQSSAGGSTMTPAAMSMPAPTVPQYASNENARVSMPSPTVPQHGLPTQGGSGRSTLTAAVVPMPSPTVPQYPAQNTGGNSAMTPASVPMPTPTVSQYTPGGGGVTSMPTPTVPQYTPGGGGATSMPTPTVPQYSSPSAPGGSTITAAKMPMPAPSSRITTPAMQMPTPASNPTASSMSMPAPTVPNYQTQASRMTPANVPMPSPSVPQYNQSSGASTVTPAAMTMPMPSVPQYGSQGSATPGGGGTSRMTPAAVSMPTPSVDHVSQNGKASKSKGRRGSRVTPAVVDMPTPTVPNYQSNRAQTSRVTQATIPMPTPTSNVTAPVMTMPAPVVSSYAQGSSSRAQSKIVPAAMSMPTPSSNMTSTVLPMPTPTVTDYTGTGSRTPGGVGMGNGLPASPSMSNSSRGGWGTGSSGAWGTGMGTGTPNIGLTRRASLHAGTTPVSSHEPLPVPPPVPGGRSSRKSWASGYSAQGVADPGRSPVVAPAFSPALYESERASPTESIDSTTRRNTEANKKSAYARGVNSPWGMPTPALYH